MTTSTPPLKCECPESIATEHEIFDGFCVECGLPINLTTKSCTCASFFTVRGKHKPDCPTAEPREEETKSQVSLARGEDINKDDWENSVAIKGGMEMMPGYMRECLIPFITTLLHAERGRGITEGMATGRAHYYERVRAEEREKLMMEYLLAFGNYVPLGGGDVEPEIMAKEVCEMMKEVGRAEERERVVKLCEEMRGQLIHSNDCSNAPWIGGSGKCDDFCQVANVVKALSDIRDKLTTK